MLAKKPGRSSYEDFGHLQELHPSVSFRLIDFAVPFATLSAIQTRVNCAGTERDRRARFARSPADLSSSIGSGLDQEERPQEAGAPADGRARMASARFDA
jgi:hypothetical protein